MSWRPLATIETIRQRARIYREIRAFFEHRDVFEVETPLLSRFTNPDPQVASMMACNQGQSLYLQTSPEFAMKRLLAAGSGSIYQICHAFREGERGRRHNPEFTLLEWYRVGFDYQVLMDEIELLIDDLSGKANIYRRIGYRDLLIEYAGIDFLNIELIHLREACGDLVSGTNASQLDFDQCLDLLISLVVSPKLKGYLFVYDYPISQAALARANNENPLLAERFELFYGDLELANGFTELTDASQQRSRFVQDNAYRVSKGMPQYPIDEQLLDALESGMPDCAGVAIGLDRLLMVLLELDSIDESLSFIEQE
jgi:lysyl-tRNA synthetase class 2